MTAAVTRMLASRGCVLLTGGLALAGLGLQLLHCLVRGAQGGRAVTHYSIYPH